MYRYAYNVTLWRVRVTTFALKTQQCVLCVLLRYTNRQRYKNKANGGGERCAQGSGWET